MQTSTIASDGPLAVVGPEHAAGRQVASVRGHARPAAGATFLRRTTGFLEDAVLLLLVVFLLPLIILLVGAPIALCVRGVIEIVRLFS